jgi:hypothetical protein
MCQGKTIHECQTCKGIYECYACPDSLNSSYSETLCLFCLTKYLCSPSEAKFRIDSYKLSRYSVRGIPIY